MSAVTPVRTVAPATNPVTLQEAKDHLRVTHSLEDTLIGALIDAAVSHLDGWTGILGRCIVSQTWRQDFECFEGDGLDLPFPDVQSASIAYYDASNTLQTYSSANYHIVSEADGVELELAYNAQWPNTYIRPDAVRVTMVCGFTEVPAAIKAAILLHVGALYANREAFTDGAMMPFAYDALIGPYRRVGL